MKKLIVNLSLLAFSSVAIGADKYDYSSPEEALSSLELAYINQDIEQAVISKDFVYEAREMLTSRFGKDVATNELIDKTAEVLELSFRKIILEQGFPDFKTIKCSSTHSLISETEALLNERCLFADGGYSVQKMLAHLTSKGWKIVGVRD